jgi:hypothetical protein
MAKLLHLASRLGVCDEHGVSKCGNETIARNSCFCRNARLVGIERGENQQATLLK